MIRTVITSPSINNNCWKNSSVAARRHNILKRKTSNHSHNKTTPTPTSPSPKQPTSPIPPSTHKNQKSISSFGIGTLAGICGSLAGMGGGFIMIPLMTSSSKILLSLPLTQHVAHGTSLFAVAATGIAGSISYATSSKQAVQYKNAFCITICAMVTARLGALYSTKLSQSTLKKILGTFMICISPVVPLKSYFVEMKEQQISTSTSLQNHLNNDKFVLATLRRNQDAIVCGGIGVASGFLAGLLGVGGGAIVVPALTLFTSMDHYTALGTSLAAMVMPAVVGTVTHYKKGNVNLRVAPALAVGSLVGAYFGGKVGVGLDEELLRYGFSSLMFGLGLRTLFKG